MQLLRQLRIGTRLSAGFALLLVLLMLLGGFGIYQMDRANFYAHDLGNNWMPSVKVLADIRNTLNQGRRASLRLFIEATPQSRQTQAQAYGDSADQQMPKLIATYEALIATPQERQVFEQWRDQFRQYVALEKKGIDLAIQGDDKLAEARAAAVETANAFTALLETVGKSMAINVEGGRRATEAAESSYRQALAVFAVVIAVALAIGLALAVLVTRSITAPLGVALEVADTVAEGDLRTQFQVAGRDETADLLRSLQNMNGRLIDIVGQVRHSSDSIATGSAEIAMGNADLSQRTEQQASNLEQTAASMEELSSTVKINAETAQQANRLAGEATTAAEAGGQVVGRVISTMQDISASSRKISDIIGVIDGIAFQTNILALNAAVEAARAGEQGRGFAVVASEVRSLAQRSADAAKEIKTLINTSVEKVESGTQLVDQAGSSMEGIVSQVRRVGALIGEITNASMEQSSGISQVGDAINQLDQVTQQNAALVEESAAAAASLKTQSQQLAALVAVFQLPGQTSFSPALAAAPAHATSPRPAQPPSSGRPSAPPKPSLRTPAKPALKAAAPAPVASTAQAGGRQDDWETF